MSQRWPDARDQAYAKIWRVTPKAAARILATGYSLEGMEILAIFARLEAMSKQSRAVQTGDRTVSKKVTV